MLKYLTGFVTILAVLVSCGPEIRTEYVATESAVPPELLRPVDVPPRRADSLQDVALILTDHKEGLDRANGQIVAIGCIVRPKEVDDPTDCEKEDR